MPLVLHKRGLVLPKNGLILGGSVLGRVQRGLTKIANGMVHTKLPGLAIAPLSSIGGRGQLARKRPLRLLI